MKKIKKIFKRIITTITMIVILAGNIFPAGMNVVADDNIPSLWFGCGMQDGRFHLNLYKENFSKVGSVTMQITYDTELLRFDDYDTHNGITGAMIDVYDDNGVLNIAIVDVTGLGKYYSDMCTLYFDVLFDGTEEITYDVSVECTDIYGETINVQCQEKIYCGLYENSKSSRYDMTPYIEYYYNELNKEMNYNCNIYANAGFYACEFYVEFDSDIVSYNGYKFSELVNGMADVCEVSDGVLKVAIISDEVINIKSQTLITLKFVPKTVTDYSEFKFRDITYTTAELEEIINNTVYWSGFVVTEGEAENIISITGPESVRGDNAFDVFVRIDENKGFGAMTVELNYDDNVFEFQSGESVNDAFSNAISNVAGGDGKVIIAVAATENTEGDGEFVKVTFKVKDKDIISSEMTLNMVEFVDTQLNDLDYILKNYYIDVVPSDSETDKAVFNIVGPESINWDGTFSVYAKVFGNKGFGAMTMELDYDEELFEFHSGSEMSGVLSNAICNISDNDGKVTIAVASTSSAIGDGQFVKITFKAKGKRAEDSEMSLNMIEFVDSDMNELEYTCYKYYVDVKADILYGDVNNNGSINVADAILLKRYIAGYDVTINMLASDVNCDGKFKVNDAILIMRYIAGYDVTLGPSEA